ncbi:hypothetical protein HPB51_025527 [Rhipicephalus microplus]|uniref:Uncharacterized protein n=1 Tax=Rhipicephalus microplus TaxID=6941 RepID=A0A9J6F940_RHIMP|nr:hypothetical protein HPB51_025527 [Rhipicephalus microplus]
MTSPIGAITTSVTWSVTALPGGTLQDLLPGRDMGHGGTHSIDRVDTADTMVQKRAWTPVHSSKWPDDGSKTTFRESQKEEKLLTTAWKKEEIQEWLTGKNITYSKRMIKKQLLELVASVKSRFLSYNVDSTAVKAGCIVLRLPPYHCEFHPNKLVWVKAKNGVAADNRDFKLSRVDTILRNKIRQITVVDWKDSIQHMMDLEAKFRLDTSGNEHIQPIIIHLREDDTNESDDDFELCGIEPLDES